MDALTQIESRLGAELDDLETVQNLFIKQYPDKFYLQFSAFEAQEKINTVLYYIRNTYLTIAQSPDKIALSMA